jgi:hypothetical protein
VSVHFNRYMLSSLIEPRHLDRFVQAIYYVESFDIQGRKWEIDKHNIVRAENATGSIDTETSWDKLGYIEDWFIERIVIKPGKWSPSLSTLKSNYNIRRKTFTKLYSIGHRRGEKDRARPGGPTLPKRRKMTFINPWTGYIVSYLEDRRVKRPLEGERYEPTVLDVERILLAAVSFVQTWERQQEEFLEEGFPNQRL